MHGSPLYTTHLRLFDVVCIYGITVTTLASLWRKIPVQQTIENREFNIPPQNTDTSLFRKKYDTTQKQLQLIAAMDDLLSGMQNCNHNIIFNNEVTLSLIFAQQVEWTNFTS